MHLQADRSRPNPVIQCFTTTYTRNASNKLENYCFCTTRHNASRKEIRRLAFGDTLLSTLPDALKMLLKDGTGCTAETPNTQWTTGTNPGYFQILYTAETVYHGCRPLAAETHHNRRKEQHNDNKLTSQTRISLGSPLRSAALKIWQYIA